MADLKTIIQITQEELRRQVPVEQAVHQALDQLKPREADVIRRRYGLRTGASETLAQIGDEFGITRERVRQIETQGLRSFQAEISKQPLAGLVKLAENLVREHGGVLSDDVLATLFLPESQQTPLARQTLRFLVEQIPGVLLVGEHKPFRAFYATSKAYQQAVNQLAAGLEPVLEKAGEPQTVATLAEQLLESDASDGVRYLVGEPLTQGVLEICTRFVECPDGRWGLASWSTINPRNIHDKTLFILKKVGTPMHFHDIAEHIRQAKFDTKKVTSQAVHNELINGDEFVLIGRGIYALTDWGYVPGTVADVIKTLLQKATEPLGREEIVEAVLKQRHVSRNTIVINLQNKNLFARVGKHTYTLANSGASAKVQPAARS